MSDYEKDTQSKFEKKLDAAVESVGNSIDNIADRLEKKYDSLDDEDIEQFFVKIGSCIAGFFTVTIPTLARKIKKVLQSDTLQALAPLLLLIIIAIICVALGSSL